MHSDDLVGSFEVEVILQRLTIEFKKNEAIMQFRFCPSAVCLSKSFQDKRSSVARVTEPSGRFNRRSYLKPSSGRTVLN